MFYQSQSPECKIWYTRHQLIEWPWNNIYIYMLYIRSCDTFKKIYKRNHAETYRSEEVKSQKPKVADGWDTATICIWTLVVAVHNFLKMLGPFKVDFQKFLPNFESAFGNLTKIFWNFEILKSFFQIWQRFWEFNKIGSEFEEKKVLSSGTPHSIAYECSLYAGTWRIRSVHMLLYTLHMGTAISTVCMLQSGIYAAFVCNAYICRIQ